MLCMYDFALPKFVFLYHCFLFVFQIYNKIYFRTLRLLPYVVPGGTSGGAKTVLRQMEALLGSSDPKMPPPLSDLSKPKKTTHFRES